MCLFCSTPGIVAVMLLPKICLKHFDIGITHFSRSNICQALRKLFKHKVAGIYASLPILCFLFEPAHEIMVLIT